MNIPLPAFLKKITQNPRFSSRKFMYTWYRYYKLLFFLLFLIVLAWGGYIWYFSIYKYSWNDAQKKEYLDKYFQEPVELRRNIFE